MHHPALLKRSDPSCFGVSFTLMESQCQLAPSLFCSLKKKKLFLRNPVQAFAVVQSPPAVL